MIDNRPETGSGKLYSDTPVVITNNQKTNIEEFVKIAQSNLFIENQPDVSIDPITKAQFDSLSAKDLISYIDNNGINTAFQVNGTNPFVNNVLEIAKSNSPANIIQSQISKPNYPNSVQNYVAAISGTNIAITVSGGITSTTGQEDKIPSPTPPQPPKIVVQVKSPSKSVKVGWGSMLN